MVKILFSCHVEPDRKSTDVNYLESFADNLARLRRPVLFQFMVGEAAADRVLKIFRHKSYPNFEFGLHIHGRKIKESVEIYKKVMGKKPDNISFGHWSFEDKHIKQAASLGVEYDLSYSAGKKEQRFFHMDTFNYFGLKEIPVVCDPKYPVNPFTSKFHFFLFFLIITWYLFSNKTLHFSFHSFDKIDWRAKLVFGLPLKYVGLRNS